VQIRPGRGVTYDKSGSRSRSGSRKRGERERRPQRLPRVPQIRPSARPRQAAELEIVGGPSGASCGQTFLLLLPLTRLYYAVFGRLPARF